MQKDDIDQSLEKHKLDFEGYLQRISKPISDQMFFNRF